MRVCLQPPHPTPHARPSSRRAVTAAAARQLGQGGTAAAPATHPRPMPATAARALSLGAPPVYVLAGGGAGPAAEVLTNADLVHAVLFAPLEPPGGAARGLLSLQEAARLSTVHPAWRDAASRIPTRLDAPPAAALAALAALPRAAADARMATLRCIDMGERATCEQALAGARALRAARPPRGAALANPSLATRWLRDLEEEGGGVSFDTILRARGPWQSAAAGEAIPRSVRALSLCAGARAGGTPHPDLLSGMLNLESITLIGFGAADFALPLPAGLRTMRLERVRPDARQPARLAGWRGAPDAAGTAVELEFERPGKAEARAGAREALVEAGVAAAAAAVAVSAPGRAVAFALPGGDGDPDSDAAAFVQGVVEAGGPRRLFSVRADRGVRVGAAAPADIARAARGTRVRVGHGPGWMACRVEGQGA